MSDDVMVTVPCTCGADAVYRIQNSYGTYFVCRSCYPTDPWVIGKPEPFDGRATRQERDVAYWTAERDKAFAKLAEMNRPGYRVPLTAMLPSMIGLTLGGGAVLGLWEHFADGVPWAAGFLAGCAATAVIALLVWLVG